MFQKTRFFPDDFEEYILYTYFYLCSAYLPTYLPTYLLLWEEQNSLTEYINYLAEWSEDS